MTWTRWAPSAIVAAALVTGCATPPPPATPTQVTVSPVGGSPSASPVLPVPTTAWPLPSAYPDSKRVHSASHRVSFLVPSAWTHFDVSTFQDPAVRAALEPLAKQVGKSLDEYIHEVSTATDMIVRSPERNGRTAAVSVRREQIQSGAAPTLDEASASLRGVAATVAKVTPFATPMGAGYAVYYTRKDATGTGLAGAITGLPAAQGTIFLASVESDNAAEVEQIVTMVSSSLTRD